MHVIAAKAVSFKEALSEDFSKYQGRIVKNAKALSEALMEKGFKLVSDGTDNHLMLVDLSDKGITGKDAQTKLDDVLITVNKNAIPFDKESPFVTSGIRIGTSAVTTRGMNEDDMYDIADMIYLALTDFENSKEKIVKRAMQICEKYPLYR